jgi:hypothetical protein
MLSIINYCIPVFLKVTNLFMLYRIAHFRKPFPQKMIFMLRIKKRSFGFSFNF